MKRYFIGLLCVGFLVTLFSSCTSQSDSSSRLVHTDITLDVVDTDETDAYSDKSVISKVQKTVPGDTVIIQKAAVSSPSAADDTVMQASDVSIDSNGKYIFVTYMLQGEACSGALDIIDISSPEWPELLYSLTFTSVDLSCVYYDGSYIYIGGQSMNAETAGEYAYLRAIKFQGNKPDLTSDVIEKYLPGYFVTDIEVSGSSVYVTSGTDDDDDSLGAGAYLLSFDNSSFTEEASLAVHDARSIAVGSKEVAVFGANYGSSPATVYFCDTDLNESSTLTLSTTVMDESKAGMDFVDDYLVLAMNTNGVLVINPDDNTIETTIPAPSIADLYAELQPSNAVSTGDANSKKFYFISNGEAGLWVGDADYIASESDDWGISGTIRFSNGISVNDVAAKNTTVAAAAGLGGIRILELSK